MQRLITHSMSAIYPPTLFCIQCVCIFQFFQYNRQVSCQPMPASRFCTDFQCPGNKSLSKDSERQNSTIFNRLNKINACHIIQYTQCVIKGKNIYCPLSLAMHPTYKICQIYMFVSSHIHVRELDPIIIT